MKKIITLLLTLLCCVSMHAQDIFRLGYCEHSLSSSNGQGSDAAGKISAAIFVPESKVRSLAGNSVTRLDVGLISRINVRELTVWVRTSLDGQNLVEGTVSRPVVGWNEIKFSTPYVIPADAPGLYFGYTFQNNGTSHPVSLVGEGERGTSFFRASESAEWQDMAAVGNLSLEAIVEGAYLPQYDLALLSATVSPDLSAGQNHYRVSGMVSNVALKDVDSFRLEVRTADATVSDILAAVRVPSGKTQPFAADFSTGKRLSGPCTVTITALAKGEDLDKSNNSVASSVTYLRGVLIEEFTTEKCPNCPAGAQTLHSVLEARPDIVAVCHHSGFNTDYFTQPCDEELLWLFNYNAQGSTFAPGFMFNREPMFDSTIAGAKNNVCTNGTKSEFLEFVEAVEAQPAHAAVGVRVTKTQKTDTGARVTLTVEVEQDGSYAAQHPALTLYVTEDNVKALAQQGSNGVVADFYHQHLIRYSNGAWGDDITFSNNRWSKTYTLELKDAWKQDDLHFVAIVANHDAADKLNNRVENVVSIPCPAIQAPVDPVDPTQPITETPEGELMRDVVWRSDACYPENGKGVWTVAEGFVPNIVTNGNKMYIYAPITQLTSIAAAWIQGEVSGKTVTFHTPQPYLRNNDGTMLYATRLNATTGRKEAQTDLVFSYEDGNLRQTDGGILAITDAAGNFYGYADKNITVTRILDKVVTLPASATIQSYKLTVGSEETGYSSQTAAIAFVGNEVYFSNPAGIEGSWFCGTVEDGTIKVPTGQYLGSESGYTLYLNAAKATTHNETDPLTGMTQPVTTYEILRQPAITFTYDADRGMIWTNDLVVVNGAREVLGAVCVPYQAPFYEPWTMVPAKPATPVFGDFVDLSGYASYGLQGCMFSFTIPSRDVDGEFIAQEALYYQISYDGVPQEFYGSSYLPYYGSMNGGEDGRTFLSYGGDAHQLQTGNLPRETITIQSFYVVGDAVYASDACVYDLRTQMGIENLTDPASAVVGSYSLSGIRQSAAQPGFRIQWHADGTSVKQFVR